MYDGFLPNSGESIEDRLKAVNRLILSLKETDPQGYEADPVYVAVKRKKQKLGELFAMELEHISVID